VIAGRSDVVPNGRGSRATPRIGVVLLALLCAVQADPLAYLILGSRSQNGTVTLRWAQLPVRYFIRDRGVPGVSPDQARLAFESAFRTWQDLPTAAIRYEFVGFTSASPLTSDGMTTLGFEDEADQERVLGATRFIVDRVTGELVESDIFFNTAFAWSTSAAGESGRYDLQSVALHEIGHLGGLGHSQLGETEVVRGGRRVLAAEAVMFPIAFSSGSIVGRALRADDIAGISDIYPDGDFRSRTGQLRGRVTKNGRGVFGAHVIVFHLESGRLVAGFTFNDQGEFSISGLQPGPHIVRVEPIDDADVESFTDPASPVDTDFSVTILDRLAVVSAGGTTGSLEIVVRAR
jgi:matrixin